MSSESQEGSEGISPRARLVGPFRGRTTRLHVQFLRYVLAGGVATLADLSVYLFLVKLLAVHYLVGNPCGFSMGMVVNYLLGIWWVFAHRRLRSKQVEFLIFVLVGVVGLGISELCLYVGVRILGIHDVLSKIGSIIPVLAWTFSARKLLLFRKVG